jgi:hypothetical protein
VTSPPAKPPRYGLLTAAPVVNDDDLRTLYSGWGYQPEACANAGIGDIACAGNVPTMDLPVSQPGEINGDPLWLWSGDECSTFGFEARDWEGRARRSLQATESFQLANELWDGAIATSATLANRFFSGNVAWSDTVTGGPTAVATALASVEQGLAEVITGQQGMVHMTPQVLTHCLDAGVVFKDSGAWITANGHIVVADAGYSGDGPGADAADATSQWIFGTSLLQVRLGPVELIPGSIDDARNLAASMDRQLNDIVVIAGRMAGVQWANHCGFIAGEVNVPIPLIAGAS